MGEEIVPTSVDDSNSKESLVYEWIGDESGNTGIKLQISDTSYVPSDYNQKVPVRPDHGPP